MSNAGFDFYRTNIPPEIISLIPESVARENSVIAVREDDYELVVALADPEDRHMLDKLRFILNRSIVLVFATPQAIRFAIEKYYPA